MAAGELSQRSTSFGAFGATRDDAMVARWSADPLGML
jgi:hypothetical protein